MNNIIILVGHGDYAKGLLSSLNMLSGADNKIFGVSFDKNDDESALELKINNIINKNLDSGIIISCDLLGGTPYKVSARLSFFNSNIRVVTGANLGGIIDTKLKLDILDLDKLAENIVSSSIKNVILFKKEIKKAENDGI